MIAAGIRWIVDKLGLLALIVGLLLVAAFASEQSKKIEETQNTIDALISTKEAIEIDLRKAKERFREAASKYQFQIRELADAEEVALKARDSASQCLEELAECGWACQLRDYAGYKKRELECLTKVSMAESLESQVIKVRESPIYQIYIENEKQAETLERQLEAQQDLIDERQNFLESSWFYRFFTRVKEVLPAAFMILVAVLAMPFGIRAIFYYLLAPQATQLPPITILPANDPPQPEQREQSAVSLRFAIPDGEELIAQPHFLQSTRHAAGATTQWFLNKRLPFASITSGMFLLTRIQPEETGPHEIVVSATQDPLDEIGIVELPTGAAMVLQPRSLAGVVKPVGIPVQISSCWRLFSLHAWLTMQLRYLVFHGPCRLIIKGCRGIRLEIPDSNEPRMIRQSATIGWSANLDYKTVRCETFMPYLRGKEELFSDMFFGETGKFAYEEVPNGGRRKGALSRGLEGLFDAFLKAFGI